MLSIYFLSPLAEIIYLLIFFALFISMEEFESGWSGFWATVGLLIFLTFFSNPWGITFQSIWDNKLVSLGVFILYFVIGGAYSLFKWWRYLANKVENFKSQHFYDKLDSYLPKAIDNKSKIMWWIGYWPISFVWMLISDPFTKICKAIYNQLAKAYDRIRANVLSQALNNRN